jgi:predicted cobalt transporter CbtA
MLQALRATEIQKKVIDLMKTLTFISISILSGIIAGIVLAIVNQAVVTPYIERAVGIENQKAIARGEVIDPAAMAAYRLWQKEGSVVAGAILGLAYGALLGAVFAYARSSLPGRNNMRKALLLAGIMWFTLYLVVALKYPANPPAVGNPDTIYLRESLYVIFMAISGFSALGLSYLHRILAKKKNLQTRKKVPLLLIPILLYVAIMAIAFFALPNNPDAITIPPSSTTTVPMDLIISFRVVTAITMSMFWGLLGILLGVLWDRTKPHETKLATA